MKIKTDRWDREEQMLKEENKEIAKTVKCTYTGKCNMKGRICYCCYYYIPKKRKN